MYGDSKTFCIQPWVHQMVTSTGDAGFCCVASPPAITGEDGLPVSLREGRFDRAWNCGAMRGMRRDMLEGRPVRACEVCRLQEKAGKKSYRQLHNAEWASRLGEEEVRRRVEESLANGYALESLPVSLHLCLGNLCNLKCRMCNPHNSVMIHREWGELDSGEGGAYSGFWHKYGCGDIEMGPWPESEAFWKSCESIIPVLEKVYLTGGEPTLIRGNYRFMRKCVELGRAAGMDLLLSINCTEAPDEFLELTERFGRTDICVSLDGTGAVGEYIRYPGRWDVVSRNFSKLAGRAGPNVSIGVTPVVQIYNILDLVPLFKYVEAVSAESGRPVNIQLLDCLRPAFLDIGILPRDIKEEAIRRLAEFRDRGLSTRGRNCGPARPLKEGLDALINRLRADGPADSPQLLKAFSYYTRTLDAHRGQDFSRAIPDLAALLRV